MPDIIFSNYRLFYKQPVYKQLGFGSKTVMQLSFLNHLARSNIKKSIVGNFCNIQVGRL